MAAATRRPAAPPPLLLLLLAASGAPRVAPLTIWEVGLPQGHIEVRRDLPAPREFYDEYIQNRGGSFEGVGKPVLFKGAARQMPAFDLWTDAYLRRRHGNVTLDQVETEKKETRTKYPKDDWSLAKFLDRYNSSDIYSTAEMPKGLSDEVYLLPPINCGGYHAFMATSVIWFSSGQTKSVIHSDAQQNIHCMIAGKKDWILWRPDSGIDTPEFGWIHAEQEAKSDPAFKDAYGTYVGRVDVDDVDTGRFPGWSALHWWRSTLEAGDCVYLPPRWFHFVESPKQRSISVHAWFQAPKKFHQRSCDDLARRGLDAAAYLVRFSDCTWGREDRAQPATRCDVQGGGGRPAPSAAEL